MNITPESCNKALKEMSVIVDAELSRTLEERAKGPVAHMYNMLRYFLGYVDADFVPTKEESGKRFRPSLCLLLADAYGAREKALEAAVAIELFHNFTLIHDDVEDRDEYRRNKPTVWKLWGINHAINSGDVQSLLATEWITRAARQSDVGARLAKILTEAFIEVGEGQHLDFELGENSLETDAVSEERYFLMTEKKSGVLVRVSAEVAGVAGGKDEKECSHLREYGTYFGMAYQMADDYRSVWTTQTVTGKDTHSDIREHKRTLPFLYTYTELTSGAKNRLKELYSLSRQLSESEIVEVSVLFDSTHAREKVRAKIHEYVFKAKQAAEELTIPEETRAILMGLIDMLVPEGSEETQAIFTESIPIALI
ncbi:hypothetical protein A3A38_02540 [Candidatus Kaiserbacteria bacterium RIFCSPLOWO2_01_FULL_53_17]|uniref:Polyprenyl synthetase n=1 Tax=Candidatus Kaiserbacteria bacterium RIFCSPLOWO2_01_FULL_53_17 TaxID=1798511 RepID=A0A1F6EGN6_9BACT|nr:MAG: hypothetical protein A3A38_02540 [Candidatus Kaiserbacteria bacterium RIFCSPLOWO2_01_FULL_53_17]